MMKTSRLMFLIITSASILSSCCVHNSEHEAFARKIIWVKGVTTESIFWRAPGIDCFRPVNSQDILIDTSLIGSDDDGVIENYASVHNRNLPSLSLKGCEK